MENFLDILSITSMALCYFYLLSLFNKQNKKIEKIMNHLFYYDQQYKDIIYLKNKLYELERKI
jgi:hypothetical protein